MKVNSLLNASILLLAGCGFLSCSETTNKDSNTINVATALSSPGEITASAHFSQVRYLPLETTDSSLIGPAPDIRFFGDKLVVTTQQKQCLLFDAITGRFIRTIGHIGEDPEGNKSVSHWINTPAQTLNLEG